MVYAMTQKRLTRSEVLANRQKVITFLLQPKRKKAKGALDKGEIQFEPYKPSLIQ